MASQYDLFISYCQDDYRKVQLIEQELKSHPFFKAIIIASNSEPLKPLAHKVSEGLKNSQVIIPLLTSNSIANQWVNQEVGFATALGKTIKPIVEIEIIEKLKGFIHKQLDLPYGYHSSSSKSKENKDFIGCFRELLRHLELEYKPITNQIIAEVPKEPDAEDIANEINRKKELLKKRDQILKSEKAIQESDTAVGAIIKIIENRVVLLRSKGIAFPREQFTPKPHRFILQSEHYSISIEWNKDLKYHTTTGVCIENNSELVVKLADGLFLNDDNGSGKNRIKMTNVYKYTFDLIGNSEELGWKWASNKQIYSNEAIAEMSIKWILDKINETILV